MDKTLIIMAAGMGSRFGGLKQVEPVGPNKEFILDYSVYDALKAGFNKVVFVIKEENYDLFRDTIGKRIESKIKVDYVFQKLENIPNNYKDIKRVSPWGTSHAIMSCKEKVNENFAVINADDFYGRESFKIAKEYLDNTNPDSYDFANVTYIVKNTLSENGFVKRGLCKEINNKLKSITECSIGYENNQLLAKRLEDDVIIEIMPNDLVSMNLFLFTPKIFKYLEDNFEKFLSNMKNPLKDEYLLPVCIQNMIDKNICAVEVLKTPSIWYGITYKEDKEALVNKINELIKNKIYPKNLWK